MKTQYSRRELYALGEPLGESSTRTEVGRRVYGGGGGGGAAPTPTSPNTAPAPFSSTSPAAAPAPSSLNPMTQTDAQQGVAGYAQPYVNTMLGATMQNLFDYDQYGNATGMRQYTPYSYNPADYVAGFSPLQQQAQYEMSGLQDPYQTQQASRYANQAIRGLMNQQYNPQTGGYMSVQGSQADAAQLGNAPTMQAAQFQGPAALQAQNVAAERVNAPQLQALSMQAAKDVGSQDFTQPGTAASYMNPYTQNVVDIQKREAQRQAGIAGTQRGAQAARAGAFGGSRQAIENAEAQRNLATQMGDIQAQGQNAAYQNAMQQFNADQARQLQANLANQGNQQQANLQNLSAGLQTQGLGAQTGLQAQQLNQATGLQALLANQQAGLTAGQANQNMAYNTAAQNAQLAQQAGLANQALAGQYGLQQGQFGQAANLQNAQLAQQANIANQNARQQAQQLAAQQQQFGANFGQQGLQSALSGANTLGGLGTSSLNNQLARLNAQQATGLTQQQQQQNMINQAVQNYNTAQQYPMTQLGQMKNMLSGLPISTTSTQGYQAAPTNLQNLMALGMGGYGISQLMGGGGGGAGGGGGISGLLNQGAGLIGQGWDAVKGYLPFNEGGPVRGYKQGGVTSEENVASIANFLPTQQLPRSLQMAQGRGDVDAETALQKEMAERASIQRGLGGAFNQLPQGAQQNVIRAASGGIIAFNGDEDENDPQTGQMVSDNSPSPGNPKLQGLYGDKLLKLVNRMETETGPKLMTPGEVSAAEQAEFNRMQKFAGPSPYGDMRKRLTEDEAARGETLQQGKGLAALQAMQGMLQPGGAMRGLGAAGSAFASSYGDALKADKAEKRYIGQMQFNLADAERKERMGLTKEARASVTAAEQAKLNAYKAGVLRDQAMGNILGKGMQATRPVGGAGAAKTPKLNEQLAAAEIAFERDPSDANLKNVTALRRAVSQTKTSDVGTTKADLTREGIISQENAKVQAAMKSFKYDPAYLEAKQAGPEEADRVWNEELARQRQLFGRSGPAVSNPPPVNNNSGNNMPPPPPGFVPR